MACCPRSAATFCDCGAGQGSPQLVEVVSRSVGLNTPRNAPKTPYTIPKPPEQALNTVLLNALPNALRTPADVQEGLEGPEARAREAHRTGLHRAHRAAVRGEVRAVRQRGQVLGRDLDPCRRSLACYREVPVHVLARLVQWVGFPKQL